MLGDAFKQLISLAIIAGVLWFGWQNNWIEKIMESDMLSSSVINEDFAGPGEDSTRPYSGYNDKALEVLAEKVAQEEYPGFAKEEFFTDGTKWNKVSQQQSQDAGWSDFSPSNCSIRRAVLIEQGKNVQFNEDNCAIKTGDFKDSYGAVKNNGSIDYQESSNSRDFAVDHVVSLPVSWDSGMAEKDYTARNMIAHDKANLLIASPDVVKKKADRSIDQWAPSRKSQSFCDYTDRYAYIKAKYDLSVTDLEFAAIKDNLKTCNS